MNNERKSAKRICPPAAVSMEMAENSLTHSVVGEMEVPK